MITRTQEKFGIELRKCFKCAFREKSVIFQDTMVVTTSQVELRQYNVFLLGKHQWTMELEYINRMNNSSHLSLQ